MGTTARLLSLLAPAFAFMVAPKSLAAEVDESWWQVVSARIQHEEYARDPSLASPSWTAESNRGSPSSGCRWPRPGT